MIKIAPSVLSADFSNLAHEVRKVELAGADYIHLDVMDGKFVPNITFGPGLIKDLRKHSNLVFDVHLMIDSPENYISEFAKAGANIITVHAEATTHLHRTIQSIKSNGVKAAVALNPSTPLNVLDYVLDDLDMVLIMSVNPGFGGQSFIQSSLRKINELKNMIDSSNLTIDIEVDGGISLNNVQSVVKAGANIMVAGSAIYNAKDIDFTIQEFKRLGELK